MSAVPATEHGAWRLMPRAPLLLTCVSSVLCCLHPTTGSSDRPASSPLGESCPQWRIVTATYYPHTKPTPLERRAERTRSDSEQRLKVGGGGRLGVPWTEVGGREEVEAMARHGKPWHRRSHFAPPTWYILLTAFSSTCTHCELPANCVRVLLRIAIALTAGYPHSKKAFFRIIYLLCRLPTCTVSVCSIHISSSHNRPSNYHVREPDNPTSQHIFAYSRKHPVHSIRAWIAHSQPPPTMPSGDGCMCIHSLGI
ncbi:unnamed protein product [Periconia digitata]|uniref:Secreted protein n=1 Tax=Periconia digitata TaxID=1303443 RepID=A0A9W4UBD9_9PLEO|nr:unnamed protein product [Periconia digitata]